MLSNDLQLFQDFPMPCKSYFESGPSTVPVRECDDKKDRNKEEDTSNGAKGRPGRGQVGKPCKSA